ncbi:MAG: hemolysin family protein [Acidimicrobiales bacterium]|jgi:CBS domain containing-hemolysin-like protein|nr:hemolysin family protein [Acidimicrobiales bacterium]
MTLAATFGGADAALLATIVVLLVFSAALAVAEISLTRISRAKASALEESGRPGGRRLVGLVEHPERFLNPVLLLALGAQLLQATLTGILADRLFGAAGVAVAAFVNIGVVFVVAEAAPKTWAVLHAERAALLSAPPISALVSFAPLRWLSRGLIGLTNVILPGKGLKDGPYVSEEELLALADVAVEEDVIEEEERDLIESIIEFGDTVVREVMVPRPDMVTVPSGFRVADVMEVILLNGYSRLPVVGEDVDDIVGLVYAKDLMRAERDGHDDHAVATLARAARFVPETKRVAELLREMQAEQFHMAIVVDEYGGTAGVVTLEDLIEELVGEIVDEYDREEPALEPLADGRVRVNARMAVDELNELLHVSLPEGDWDSVGGLIFHLLGHIPVEGEEVVCDDVALLADKVQGRRISRVVVRRSAHADGARAEGET